MGLGTLLTLCVTFNFYLGNKMRYVVLDTETTGLNVDDGHRVIEIGCVEIENRGSNRPGISSKN